MSASLIQSLYLPEGQCLFCRRLFRSRRRRDVCVTLLPSCVSPGGWMKLSLDWCGSKGSVALRHEYVMDTSLRRDPSRSLYENLIIFFFESVLDSPWHTCSTAPHMVCHTIFISIGITLLKSVKGWMKNENGWLHFVVVTFGLKAENIWQLNKKKAKNAFLFFWPHLRGGEGEGESSL